MNLKTRNMKRSLLRISLIALSLVSGCGKILDISPEQNISEEAALGSDRNVKKVLQGAYALFAQGGIYGGNILRNSELLGGNGELSWIDNTITDPYQIFRKTMDAANADVYYQWAESYQVINSCNNVLSALNVVNEADRGWVQGEALFLRSLVYFDLVRFFGGQYIQGATNSQYGVPLILSPTRGIASAGYPGRNTVDEIYKQVINDLTTAAALLPVDNSVYADWGSATALLARVYLQMGDYENAVKAADEVIGSGKFSLLTDYAGVFNNDNNSSEDIFAVQITSSDPVSSLTQSFSVAEFGGNGYIEILQAHLNLYPSGDKRKDLFFTSGGAWRTGKWNNAHGVIHIIRLAEMYLIRAECNIRIDPSGTAYTGKSPLSDFNTIHTRAGLAPATEVTLDTILYERRLELAFEGFRIHDIRRTHEDFDIYSWDDAVLLFPVPEQELKANPSLQQEQNPGY